MHLSEGQTHLDSHADTCVCGSNFVMLDAKDKVLEYAEVSPFSDEYQPIKNIPIASCATAWQSSENGEVSILVFHQSLYFGEKLNHSLLCPNQIQDNGHKVEDTPRQYNRNSSHGITIAADGKLPSLFLPLKMQGVISYIDTCKPTEVEMETVRNIRCPE